MAGTPLLKVSELSVAFKTRNGIVEALKDVSIDVKRGEIIGLVGESGSGKSVTAYTVLGLLGRSGEAVVGHAEYSGIELTGAPEKELQDLRGREISMIFQNPRAALNPIRPVGKQIADVLTRHALATQTTARERALEMLRTVRIQNPERRFWSYPYELSGGMCQRVMIAMALACDPQLLIADEPTTGLDVTTQKAIMDLVAELARERKMSVILITHDLGLAACYCRRIAVMRHGKVVERASVRQIFTRPRNAYTKMLIAATPGPDTSLDDLIVQIGDAAVGSASDASALNGAKASVSHLRRKRATKAKPLLEVRDLVKEYPIDRGGAAGRLTGLFTKAGDEAVPASFRAVDEVSFTVGPG